MPARTLTLLCVEKFSVKNPATLGHGLSPTDLFPFPKFEVSLKGCSFESVEELYLKKTRTANENLFKVMYGMLRKREYHCNYVSTGGNFFKGDNP
jgi:hypothetical protein